MNAKDYKAIAEIIKKCRLESGHYVYYLHESLADYFEKKEYEFVDINGKQVRGKWDFDRQQFLKECGVEVKK